MQTITITGNLGKDPELRSTQSGDQVLGFSVGVKQGYGDKASTNWFRCSVWGKRGETLHRFLRKGNKVVVQGELTIGSYDGKPQFDVRANEVDFMSSREDGDQRRDEPRQGSGGGGGDTRGRAEHPADLDDDIPFIGSDISMEWRAR